ncbi:MULTISPECIES: NUDIX hydrolase [unclassified Clostridium]|uniref:NUDIX hydrolase n=1 Tax=unclassified Clostridium TaxID=2614128 RepID=UPI0008204A79|nr:MULTISPECIES: NUDIX hydrolase [unclassified Clostridium]SCI72866.1 NUDIX domain [uncultured Clostridium sp.]
MLFRSCAGGLVFCEDSVLILKNEKDEWVLPKGVIRAGDYAREVALRRVKAEAGVDAEILTSVGETNYEFYSVTRKRPVCNQVTWYLMTAGSLQSRYSAEDGFVDGGFYPIDQALEMITYSQDRALVNLAAKRYRGFKQGKL